MMHQVVLVPGFFGFGNLGDLAYFVGVREVLLRALSGAGLEAEVREVATLPTASIRQRAAKVLETIAGLAREGHAVHIVGHSTGGLDARLAIAPTASLPVEVEMDGYDVYARVRTLITVSTPHYGTPLAGFFGSAMGKPLLRVLAAASASLLRGGKLPLGVAIKLGQVFSRADDYVGQRNTVLDRLYAQLLAEFSEERREALLAFVEGISTDQSLVFQLTAAGCDVLNASTADPDRVRYGCVVTRAAPPSTRNVFGRHGDLYARSLHLVYAGLHAIAARSIETLLPELEPAQERRLEQLLGALPSRQDSDGIVPSLSQVWGEVVHAVEGDHLDVVGHYGGDAEHPAGADWLPTGSRFDRRAFEQTWERVAGVIVEQARSPRRAMRPVRRAPLEPTLEPVPES